MEKNMLLFLFMLINTINILNGNSYIIPERFAYPNELNAERKSSSPYISGDTFRAVCDFCIDEKRIPFNPDNVTKGDIVFVSSVDLEFFFTKVHPHIKKKYILITHNSDALAPGKYECYLDDDTLAAWFGSNCSISFHPKFFAIPTGFANLYWPHGSINTVNQILQSKTTTRGIFLYMNFNIETNKNERLPAWQYFKNKSFCTTTNAKNHTLYLQDLKNSHFVVSPRGNGLDCHRHWEALIMGAIPIIKHSTLDPLFEGLPVVLINDWSEVTLEFLQHTQKEMQKQTFAKERMYAQYWIDKIQQLKESIKQQ
jgi:hypothetical protein